MTDLNPRLKQILSAPEDPNATPVEKQRPEEARREWRADMLALDAPAPAMADVQAMAVSGPAGPIACRLYTPPDLGSEPQALLVYFHGGGFIRGDLDTHDSICRVLASATPCRVLSAAYRLAPENRFPAALDDAYCVTRFAVEKAASLGVDPARIAVGGDSAGGNLAAATCLSARKGGPNLRAQLLIYPSLDLVGETGSKALFSKGYLLNSLPFYVASYLGPEGDGRDPLASPMLTGDVSSLPAAIVLTAGYDPLRDEGDAFAARLLAAGVAVDHLRHPDMIHGFISLRGLLPEADLALRECARRLARRFDARESAT